MKSNGLRLIGALLFPAVLASCRIGDPISMLSSQGFEQALAALQLQISPRKRIFRVDIDDRDFTIQMQDPVAPNHVDAWTRSSTSVMRTIHWEGTQEPNAVDPTLINPQLEENRFDLADINFAAWPKLSQAAIDRANRQDPARVIRANIQRRIYLIPAPSNGDVCWTLEVSSGRERASIFANARGVITAGNFDGTLRAQNLDLYQGGKPLADAIAEIRATFGAEPSIRRFNFSDRHLWLTGASPTYPGKVGEWKWNLNGMLYSGDDPIQALNPGMPVALFSVDEVNWQTLPKVMAAANQSLKMPNGKVDGIHIAKPGNRARVVEWEAWVTDRTDRGWVTASNSGEVLRVHPPQGH